MDWTGDLQSSPTVTLGRTLIVTQGAKKAKVCRTAGILSDSNILLEFNSHLVLRLSYLRCMPITLSQLLCGSTTTVEHVVSRRDRSAMVFNVADTLKGHWFKYESRGGPRILNCSMYQNYISAVNAVRTSGEMTL